MVSGIVGLARDVDAEFVEAWTAAFASAKSEPLGRRLTKYARHASSVEKRCSNSWTVRG